MKKECKNRERPLIDTAMYYRHDDKNDIVDYNQCLSSHERTSSTSSAVVVVESSELLQEHKGQDSVGTQTGIVGSEAFPETEEPLILDQLPQNLLFYSNR